MSTILETILTHKRQEVNARKERYPAKSLEQSSYYSAAPVSLKKYLARSDLPGIIAEIKRKSPSKGFLQQHISVEELSTGYVQAGASALSVLTDNKYFGGSAEDLTIARKFNSCPILRKDFTIDEYQIIEAKSIGADVILLIAAALTQEEVAKLSKAAHALQLEVILEVHHEHELMMVSDDVDIIGVNNRNLQDFSTSLECSLEIADKIPSEFVTISESGIETAAQILTLRAAGYQGFLIGETFMRNSNPEKACAQLVAELQSIHL